jgi:DNA-binding protein HU-beta
MNKRDLVERIAEEAVLSRAQAVRAVESFLCAVQHGLIRGDRITLVGFGTFSVSERKSRVVREPRTGATMQIKSRHVPRFIPGIELKKAIANAFRTGELDGQPKQDHSFNSRSS